MGETDDPVTITQGEYNMMRLDIEDLRADLAAARAALATGAEAMAELLSAHDNLYVAHYQATMPPDYVVDPTVDIAAKAARAWLAAYAPNGSAAEDGGDR